MNSNQKKSLILDLFFFILDFVTMYLFLDIFKRKGIFDCCALYDYVYFFFSYDKYFLGFFLTTFDQYVLCSLILIFFFYNCVLIFDHNILHLPKKFLNLCSFFIDFLYFWLITSFVYYCSPQLICLHFQNEIMFIHLFLFIVILFKYHILKKK